MTITGAGGVVINSISVSSRYKKQYKKLSADIQAKVKDVLKGLKKNPRSAGIRFEKLKGYHKPSIYTVHITGNFKMSLEVAGNEAKLRCVGNHNEIDRNP